MPRLAPVHRRRNTALHREGGIVSGKSRLTGSATQALADTIAQNILLVRGYKVMLDMHLAELYGVKTKALNQAVQRNRERFPQDFMFQLSISEMDRLRSQFVTSNRGGRRYPPLAFTEQGVAMLSSVLRSDKAVHVNIENMRTFVRLRRLLSSHAELADKLAARSEEHTSELQSPDHLVCRLLLEKKKNQSIIHV